MKQVKNVLGLFVMMIGIFVAGFGAKLIDDERIQDELLDGLEKAGVYLK